MLWLCLIPLLAWATEPIGIHPEPRDSGWSFDVAPYLWLMRMDGELTIGRATGDISVSDEEILKHLKATLMLSAQVHKNRVGFFGDVVLAKLEGEGAVGPAGRVNADVTLRMIDTKFGVDYLLGPYPLASGTNAAQLTLAPYVAGRYFYLETEVSGRGPATDVQGRQQWMDPLLGVGSAWDLSRRWNIVLAGNIGGFGVGSDLSAEGLAALGYRFRFSKEVTGNVLAGYRAFYQDYAQGNFTYDVTMHGPILGLSVEF
jgi:hypothetical protein